MKIGDEVYVHGYVDEVRSDVVIIRNDGGYFGTIPSEVNCSEKPNNCEVKNYCDDCLYNDVCDNKEFFYACTSKAFGIEDEPKTDCCETCRFDDKYGEESICSTCSRHYSDCYVPKDEPQTERSEQ